MIMELVNKKFKKIYVLLSKFSEGCAKDWAKEKSSLRSYLRQECVLHALIVLIFIVTSILLVTFLRKPEKLDFLDNSIQLLSQIIAVIVGFLSIGSSVYLTSYDASETLNALQHRLEKAMSTIRKKWYGSFMRERHKVIRKPFINYLIRRSGTKFLDFFFSNQGEMWPLFIYRHYNDGVWYNKIELSRLAGLDNNIKYSVQFLHEAYICAHKVLITVLRIRNCGCGLVSSDEGTQGSINFINELDNLSLKENSPIPLNADIESAKSIINMAINSQHYIQEEIRCHSENQNWDPYLQSRFQFETTEYMLWLIYLTCKLIYLRLATLEAENPEMRSKLSEKSLEKFNIDSINDLKKEIFEIRKKTTVVYGKSSYFSELKKASIPGIGLSSIVLLIVLFAWPLIKASSTNTQIVGFSLLYSLGVASLLESFLFIFKMVLQRKKKSERYF